MKRTNKTYTKKDLAVLTSERYNLLAGTELAFNGFYPLLNDFFIMLGDAIVDHKMVYLKNWGKLVPRFKAGGREVRNPRTKETMPMQDRWTVTRCKANDGEELEKVLYSDMIEWVNNYSMRHMRNHSSLKVTESMIGVFLDVINNLGEGERLEIRGFGVFYAKTIKQRVARNPKTGEKVIKEEGLYKRFRLSAMIVKRLNK